MILMQAKRPELRASNRDYKKMHGRKQRAAITSSLLRCYFVLYARVIVFFFFIKRELINLVLA